MDTSEPILPINDTSQSSTKLTLIDEHQYILESCKERNGQETVEHVPFPQPPLHSSQIHPTPTPLDLEAQCIMTRAVLTT